jgi:hypothetical protein
MHGATSDVFGPAGGEIRTRGGLDATIVSLSTVVAVAERRCSPQSTAHSPQVAVDAGLSEMKLLMRKLVAAERGSDAGQAADLSGSVHSIGTASQRSSLSTPVLVRMQVEVQVRVQVQAAAVERAEDGSGVEELSGGVYQARQGRRWRVYHLDSHPHHSPKLVKHYHQI